MYYTYPAEQVAYTVKNEYEYGTAIYCSACYGRNLSRALEEPGLMYGCQRYLH